MNRSRFFIIAASFIIAGTFATQQARASFHIMQIEQVIGGVNGDTSAQAIQLRMRNVGQNLMQFSRLVAHDATGANPVVVATFSGPVSNSSTGSRVLIASSNFLAYTSPTAVPDQTMAALIPASYLAAGSLTFEDSGGSTIYWRLSWGGASYTGSNAGSITNDADGNFGPPFAGPLPSTNLTALQFPGAATNPSTNNAANYAVTAGAAVFTNNVPKSFTVTSPSPTCGTCPGDLDGNSLVNGADIDKFVSCMIAGTPSAPGCVCGDQDNDSTLDLNDVAPFVDILLGNTAPASPCS